MAKGKRKRSRQSTFSKVVNIGLIALGMSRVLELVFNNLGNPGAIPDRLISGATFHLAQGSFIMEEGAKFYGAPAAAISTGLVLKFLRKKFPVR